MSILNKITWLCFLLNSDITGLRITVLLQWGSRNHSVADFRKEWLPFPQLKLCPGWFLKAGYYVESQNYHNDRTDWGIYTHLKVEHLRTLECLILKPVAIHLWFFKATCIIDLANNQEHFTGTREGALLALEESFYVGQINKEHAQEKE